MIRGRRVGILVALALVPALLQPLAPASQKYIEQNSVYSLDASSYRNLAIMQVQVKNESSALPSQTVQAFLLRDDQLDDWQQKTTDEEGKTSFTFVYRKGYSYQIIILNSSYLYPFIMKTVSF